jgi:hypothetical protein
LWTVDGSHSGTRQFDRTEFCYAFPVLCTMLSKRVAILLIRRSKRTARSGGACSASTQQDRNRSSAMVHRIPDPRLRALRAGPNFIRCSTATPGQDVHTQDQERAYAGTSSTPASATELSRSGAVTTAWNPSASFQMLAFSVSPGTPRRRTGRRRSARGSRRRRAACPQSPCTSCRRCTARAGSDAESPLPAVQ